MGGHHFDVQPGGNGFFCGFFSIPCNTVCDQFADGIKVGDNSALEIPFIPQNAGKQVWAGTGRNAVENVKSGHYHFRPGLQRRAVGGQIGIVENAAGHVHCIVFPSSFGRSIGGEMFDTGSYMIRLADVCALITAYGGGAEYAVQ